MCVRCRFRTIWRAYSQRQLGRGTGLFRSIFLSQKKNQSLRISCVLWYPLQSAFTQIWCCESCWRLPLDPSPDKRVRVRVCVRVGGWWRLSVCLDGLDQDIKGKQRVALLRGHRRGQTRLFSIWVGVSGQGCLSCSLMIGGGVSLPAVIFFFWKQICLMITCDSVFYIMPFTDVS